MSNDKQYDVECHCGYKFKTTAQYTYCKRCGAKGLRSDRPENKFIPSSPSDNSDKHKHKQEG